MSKIIPNVFEILSLAPEDQLLAFADHMAIVGNGSKTDYLRVRAEILSELSCLETEQKEAKVYERDQKSQGMAHAWGYVDSRRDRHTRRETITAWLAVRRLSKVWAAQAQAGDPQMIAEREMRCAALRTDADAATESKIAAAAQLKAAQSAFATHEQSFAEIAQAYKAAQTRMHQSGEMKRRCTLDAMKTENAEQASVKALAQAEKNMIIAKAAIAASASENTL